MGESKTKGDEEKKLGAILERYDALLPKVADTKKACDSLWKSYQVLFYHRVKIFVHIIKSSCPTHNSSLWGLNIYFKYTDELTPHMEWLTEKKVLATRDINSNSAG